MADPYAKLKLNDHEAKVMEHLVDAIATLLHQGYHDLNNTSTDKDRVAFIINNAGVRACLVFAQNVCLLKYNPAPIDYEIGVQTRRESVEMLQDVIAFSYETANETAKGNLS